MEDSTKFLFILKKLKLRNYKSAPETKEELVLRLEQNLIVLKETLNDDLKTISHYVAEALKTKDILSDIHIPPEEEQHTTHIVYMMYILVNIIKLPYFTSNDREDLISVEDINVCILAVQDLSILALTPNIHMEIRSQRVIGHTKHGLMPNFSLLRYYVIFFMQILKMICFHIHCSMDVVLLHFMAAIYSLLYAHNQKEITLDTDELSSTRAMIEIIWNNISKEKCMLNTFMLMGSSRKAQWLIQPYLRQMIQKDNGYATFVNTFETAIQRGDNETTDNPKHINEIMAKIIVSFKSAAKKIIPQIMSYIKFCLISNNLDRNFNTALFTLRELFDSSDLNKTFILSEIELILRKFVDPGDLLTGFIVMEENEFSLTISILYHLFCISTVECIPSGALGDYLCMFLQIFRRTKPGTTEKKHLANIITRYLNNQPNEELVKIVEKLFLHSNDWRQLHERISIVNNAVHIVSTDDVSTAYIPIALCEVFAVETHYTLTYDLFMILLKLILSDTLFELEVQKNDDISLMETENDVINYLLNNYSVPFGVVHTLNGLIELESLKMQLKANDERLLQTMIEILEKYSENAYLNSETSPIQTQIIFSVISVLHEILKNSTKPENYIQLLSVLEKLTLRNIPTDLKQRLSEMEKIIKGEKNVEDVHEEFERARYLIEQREPFLQKEGMCIFEGLLKSDDEHALANGHIILILAIDALRSRDSYAFLSAINLFKTLVEKLSINVIEVLCDLYLENNDPIDKRLIVGEAIVKVCADLGSLCYKYKTLLVHTCFQGARSYHDEFRMSAFANLGQFCRILFYQIDNFFYELLILVENELNTGKYVPAQRAAVLVLSEILEGMENILQFADKLSPLYKILTALLHDSKCDEQIRKHVKNGLHTLNMKCKEFFEVELKLEKEIRILNINEDKNSTKKLIVELNHKH